MTLFKANLLLFGGLFENTYRDGFFFFQICISHVENFKDIHNVVFPLYMGRVEYARS